MSLRSLSASQLARYNYELYLLDVSSLSFLASFICLLLLLNLIILTAIFNESTLSQSLIVSRNWGSDGCLLDFSAAESDRNLPKLQRYLLPHQRLMQKVPLNHQVNFNTPHVCNIQADSGLYSITASFYILSNWSFKTTLPFDSAVKKSRQVNKDSTISSLSSYTTTRSSFMGLIWKIIITVFLKILEVTQKVCVKIWNQSIRINLNIWCRLMLRLSLTSVFTLATNSRFPIS